MVNGYSIRQMLHYNCRNGLVADIAFYDDNKTGLWVLRSKTNEVIAFSRFKQGIIENNSSLTLYHDEEDVDFDDLGVCFEKFILWYNEGFRPSHKEFFGSDVLMQVGPKGVEWNISKGAWGKTRCKVVTFKDNSLDKAILVDSGSNFCYNINTAISASGYSGLINTYKEVCGKEDFGKVDGFGYSVKKSVHGAVVSGAFV